MADYTITVERLLELKEKINTELKRRSYNTHSESMSGFAN